MVDTFDRLQGARAGLADKQPVRAATTANITLSGFQTVDGVTFASTDSANGYNMRILVKNQTDTTANGVYTVSSGTWARTKDFDGNTDFVKGTLVYVTDGSANGGSFFVVSSSDPQVVGTNAISFSTFSVGDLDTLTIHGADIASAATIDLDAATGDLVDVTGTTTITAITLANGRQRVVRFTGALTLTHGASLVLPGSQNITTASGDYAIFRGYASGIVRCAVYQRFNSHPLITGTATVASATTTDLGSVREQVVTVSGTTTITSFGSSAPVGAVKVITFSGALTLTHNATSLILPTGINITTVANDTCIAEHISAGNWRVIYYPSSSTDPTVQRLTSGSGTATPTANVVRWRVRMVGGGGGGGGASGAGGNGGNTSLGSWTAIGGAGGGVAAGGNVAGGAGGTGGVDGTGTQISRFDGENGNYGGRVDTSAYTGNIAIGGKGGQTPFGGAGAAVQSSNSNVVGLSAKTNTGSGGSAAAAAANGGGGGGAGEYVEFYVSSPTATAYAVGAAGAAGAGTPAGGAGAAGVIIIEEFYS